MYFNEAIICLFLYTILQDLFLFYFILFYSQKGNPLEITFDPEHATLLSYNLA